MKSVQYMKEDIPEGKMAEYILASANLPIFQMEKIDGKIFIDGGVYDNLPAQLLINKGYKDLVFIRTFAFGRVRKIRLKETKTLVIEPSEDLGNILDFRPIKGQYLLQLGYYDVIKKLRQLKGSKYYIQPKTDEKFYIDFLIRLSDSGMKNLADALGMGKLSGPRLTFEHIIPLLGDVLDLPKTASYEDIVLGVAEWMADKIELERFTIYSVDDFLHAIRIASTKQSIFRKPRKFPALLLKNELGAKLFKEKILQEISWFITTVLRSEK